MQGKPCPGAGLAGRFAGFVFATDGSPMADLDVAESICQGPAKAPAIPHGDTGGVSTSLTR